MQNITRLKQLLNYDPLTGILTWKKNHFSVKIGQIAGAVDDRGYRRISVNGKSYLAHRIAWTFIHDAWPNNQIDHINGNRDDNRATNLRDVTNRTNIINSYKHRNGKLPGATYLKRLKQRKHPWQAQIRMNGRQTFLGCFATKEEAHKAYMKVYNELESLCENGGG